MLDVESWKVLVKQLLDCLALNITRAVGSEAADKSVNPGVH